MKPVDQQIEHKSLRNLNWLRFDGFLAFFLFPLSLTLLSFGISQYAGALPVKLTFLDYWSGINILSYSIVITNDLRSDRAKCDLSLRLRSVSTTTLTFIVCLTPLWFVYGVPSFFSVFSKFFAGYLFCLAFFMDLRDWWRRSSQGRHSWSESDIKKQPRDSTLALPCLRTDLFSRSLIRFLSCFKWLCRGETRHAVELSIAEIQRDIRGMKKEKRKRWFIQLVVFKHTVGTIVPILFDSGVRVLAKLGPIARWLLPK